MVGTASQLGFLALAAFLGYGGQNFWWLVPLTMCMGLIGWLTDPYWKIRFYDIYGAGDWTKFWLETLAGMAVFAVIAFAIGRMAKRVVEAMSG